MKKQTIAFLILIFMAAGLAAESGYKGIPWGSNEAIVEFYEGTKQTPINLSADGNKIKVYKKIMLGDETNVFYLMSGDIGLLGVFYITSNKNNEKLTFNLKSKNKFQELPFFKDKNDEMRKATREVIDDEMMVELSVGLYIYSFAGELETNGRFENEMKGDGLLSIYDYNDDTRLYIFENVIPDITIVGYIPHIDDF